MLSRRVVLLTVLLASSSCYRRVALVEALSSDEPFSKTYYLFPGNKNVSSTDLEFRDISRHLHRTLFDLGYRPAATAGDAGLLIVVMYGVSAPLTQRQQMTIPITQYVPGRSYGVNTSTNTSSTAVGTGGFATGHSNTLTTGTISESGRYETTYQSSTYTTTSYVSFIDLRAFDAQAVARAAETDDFSLGPVWTSAIFSSERSGDLRKQAPELFDALAPYIGTTTPGRVKLHIP